ncbi:MAG: hypothetical protein M1831_001526 [Alyxoria varia]|nr:MAG: hypothetical protein M1831_001526 [Alyxoria varia]
MKLSNLSTLAISATIFLWSSTPAAADNILHKQCYCEAPSILARADSYIYRSERLNHVFRWTGRDSLNRGDAGAESISQRCKDENTCVSIPNIGATALAGGPKKSCTEEVAELDGEMYKVCGNMSHVSVRDRVRGVLFNLNGKTPIMDCTDICRATFPEELGIGSVCNKTEMKGDNKGKLVQIGGRKEIKDALIVKGLLTEEFAACRTDFYAEFDDI